jgi:hypothetical protein
MTRTYMHVFYQINFLEEKGKSQSGESNLLDHGYFSYYKMNL